MPLKMSYSKKILRSPPILLIAFMFSDCTEIANGKLCQSTADNNSDSNSHSIVCDFVSFYRWETPDKHVTKVRMYVLVYH